MVENLLYAPFVSVLVAVRPLSRLILKIQMWKPIFFFLAAVRCLFGISDQFINQVSLRLVKKMQKCLKSEKSAKSNWTKLLPVTFFLSLSRSHQLLEKMTAAGNLTVGKHAVHTVSLLSFFLNVHPTGAAVDVLCLALNGRSENPEMPPRCPSGT